MKRLKLYGGLFLLFASGFVIGAILTVLVIVNGVNKVLDGGPEASRKSTVSRLAWQLKLDESQRQSLDEIMKDFQARTIGVRQQSYVESTAALEEAYRKFRPELKEKQQEKLDKLYETALRRLKLHSTIQAPPAQ